MTADALVTGVLADALAEHRDPCNAVAAAARRTHADFDTDVLAAQLRGPVRDLVEACEQVSTGSGSRVLAAVFPIVTDLVAQHRLGAAGGHDALAGVLPRLAHQVADEPRLVVGSLANAVVHLERAGLPVDVWLERVAAAAPHGDAGVLLRAGQVAAWAIGLSHARGGALDLAAGLDPQVLAAALGTADPLEPGPTVERLRADRWWRPADTDTEPDTDRPDSALLRASPGPAGAARVVARVGAFRGFGGQFLVPPVVVVRGDEVVVRSGSDAWTLHADAYGATLTRAAADAPFEPPAAVTAAAVPPGIEPLSAAAVGDLAAVTIAASYQVLVVEPGR